MNRILKYLAVLVILILIAGCVEQRPTPPTEQKPTEQPTAQPTEPKQNIITGEMKNIGNGTIRSWINLEDDRPLAIGVTFGEDVLKNLPENETEYTLSLPTGTIFNHIAVDWNPRGHEPPGIYDKPHFDFHFYMVDLQYRNNITDTERMERTVSSEYIPAGYISTPGGVPNMGAHWIDPSSSEFNNQTFTKTFIYGFYDGRVIFMEPMITKAFLDMKMNTRDDIKLPDKYPDSGYYPTEYSIRYSDITREYTVSLGGMVLRS